MTFEQAMDFPNTFEEFVNDYSFKDREEVYTNGSELIQTFRVMQGYEHFVKQKKHDTDLLDKVAERIPKEFCTYCNQEACEGGMVGTIQECETIRMIKDVIDGIIEDMKAEVSE